MIWHLGNTTVRNPLRIRDALIAYMKHGPIERLFESEDIKHADLFEILKKEGVIDTKAHKLEQKAWYGRKWRLAFREMGLIANKEISNYKQGDITKTGEALIEAETDAEIQNIFLRIIFNLEARKKGYKKKGLREPFKPIPFIINVLLLLEKMCEPTHLTQHEYALVVQNYTSDKPTEEYANKIIKLRISADNNKGKLSHFYKYEYQKLAAENKIKPETIRSDYPDLTMRLLKLSGLFIEKGHGIRLNPQYKNIYKILASDIEVCESSVAYYEKLTNIPSIPIDKEKSLLISVIKDNYKKIALDIPNVEEPDYSLSSKKLELIRVKQENSIRELNEIVFARKQRHKTETIFKWLLRLENGKDEEFDDEYISFSKNERPQYLEWVIWRAFLSINYLSNNPFESRQFRIDNSFKPIHHAPGGKPDLIFEFDDFKLVVEVTLTSSDRQVAVEGVPVRRHVADVAYQSDKPTYCLFIAPKIDINTISGYRTVNQYIINIDGQEIEQSVDIIPVCIETFKEFFANIPKANKNNPKKILNILQNCRANIALPNREWESYINSQFVSKM